MYQALGVVFGWEPVCPPRHAVRNQVDPHRQVPQPSSAEVTDHLCHTQIIFDTFYVIPHASLDIDQMRCTEQRRNMNINGTRWMLLNRWANLGAPISMGWSQR